jgi:hypothetical protein
MLPLPTAPFDPEMADTALQAAGGGTVLTLDSDSARPGHAIATVLRHDGVVHVILDAQLGTAVVTAPRAIRPTAAPSRRSVPALH